MITVLITWFALSVAGGIVVAVLVNRWLAGKKIWVRLIAMAVSFVVSASGFFAALGWLISQTSLVNMFGR